MAGLSTKAIKTRIKSMQSTRQITKEIGRASCRERV